MCSLGWGLAFICISASLIFASPALRERSPEGRVREGFRALALTLPSPASGRGRKMGPRPQAGEREKIGPRPQAGEGEKLSSEATRNVILGLLLGRLREEDLGRAELDQLAEIH